MRFNCTTTGWEIPRKDASDRSDRRGVIFLEDNPGRFGCVATEFCGGPSHLCDVGGLRHKVRASSESFSLEALWSLWEIALEIL